MSFESLYVEHQYNNLSIYVMLLLVTLFVWIQYRDKAVIKFKWRMLMSSYEAEHYFRTNEGKLTLTEILLLSLFCIVISLGGLRFVNQGVLEDWLFLGYGLMLFVLYQAKVLLLKLIGFLTGKTFELDFYKYTVDVIYKLLGVAILPVLILAYLSDGAIAKTSSYLILIFLILAIIVKFIKLIQIANKYLKFYKIYFFIYFCTLEILPNLVLIKVIFENSNIYG